MEPKADPKTEPETIKSNNDLEIDTPKQKKINYLVEVGDTKDAYYQQVVFLRKNIVLERRIMRLFGWEEFGASGPLLMGQS